MTTHLLTRHDRRSGPYVALHGDIALAQARVHECTGPARRVFALWVASHLPGRVLWIAPGWLPEQLHPDGMAEIADPDRVLFAYPDQDIDLLWSAEEALRSGAVALVVADLPAPPTLTPVRRLQLAAEAGATPGPAPLGLLLTPDDDGTRGVESRWHMAPGFGDGHPRWRLERRRARSLPPRAWDVTQPAAQAASRARLTLSDTI